MIPYPHIIKVYKTNEKDDWGLPLISAPVDYPAFVQYSSDRVKTNQGEEVKISLNITIKGNVEIYYEDQVEFRDIKKQPLSVEKIYDLQGKVIATKVLL